MREDKASPPPPSIFAQCTQVLANFAVDARCILRGDIDQVRPALAGLVEFGLSQQVGSLQNGFERVAQIVRQSAQFCNFILFGVLAPSSSRSSGLLRLRHTRTRVSGLSAEV